MGTEPEIKGMATIHLPPGPKQLPLVGNLLDFLPDMPDFLLGLAAEYGDLASFRLGRQQAILVNRPDLVGRILVTDAHNFRKGRGFRRAKLLLGEGLLTSEGDFHLRQRRLAQKAFYKKHLDGYAECMVSYARQEQESWDDGDELDLAETMMRLTLRIVGKTLFDKDVTADAREVGEALGEFLDVFPLLLIPGSELLDRLPVPTSRRIDDARRRLDAIVYEIIAARRRDPKERSDLLSMLMLATDDEGDGTGMSDDQLRDEALTIFLAGHETTANALAWTFYLLSLYPEARARFHRELREVLEGRLPTIEDLDRLVYTRAVMAEAMRLYPPAWGVTRECLSDYELEEYRFAPGTLFFVCPLVVQRDARNFDNPLAFDPERFLEKVERPRYAYFPFGAGQRICLGERFAWMEGVLLLAVLGQAWDFAFEGNRPVGYKASMTLRPKDGLPMRLHRRTAQSGRGRRVG